MNTHLDIQGVCIVSTHVSSTVQDAVEGPPGGEQPLRGVDPDGYALVPHHLCTDSKS